MYHNPLIIEPPGDAIAGTSNDYQRKQNNRLSPPRRVEHNAQNDAHRGHVLALRSSRILNLLDKLPIEIGPAWRSRQLALRKQNQTDS